MKDNNLEENENNHKSRCFIREKQLIRKMFALIICLLIFVGCKSNTETAISIVDAKKYKDGDVVEKKENKDKITVSSKFNIANDNFSLYNPKSICDKANINKKYNNENNFSIYEKQNSYNLEIELYTFLSGKCTFIDKIKNVSILGNNKPETVNALYIFITEDNGTDEDEKSIIEVRKTGLKKIYKSNSIIIDLNIKNDILYFTDTNARGEAKVFSYNSKTSDFKEIDLNFDDKEISRLYINGENIDVLTTKDKRNVIYSYNIKEFEEGKYNPSKFFLDDFELDNSGTITGFNDKVYFYGMNNLICKSDYSECQNVKQDYIIPLTERYSIILTDGGENDLGYTYILDENKKVKEKILNHSDNQNVTIKDNQFIVETDNAQQASKLKDLIVSYNLID